MPDDLPDLHDPVPPYAIEALREGKGKDIGSNTDALASLNVTRGRWGETVLHIAVILGDVDVVPAILRAGAFVDSEDCRMNTPLYYACTHPGEGDKELDEDCHIAMATFYLTTGLSP
uniref:Uncharacterized protein n=1 Tax=Chromera velia CCMP2878 TaxID=1169474 RepID=A0A0G4HGG2_9ALVE|eukprot:Cvel_27221.t1-p1 / transcript=Cvel_27221.t1 / gene=Cvel_27221 / organism=Chromera_velia_CCMP2878 / gene_product=hypothetical protein / transcript_product=hypothetical protein / location=Cvel_scaffold3366:11716-12063(+) / protein_length=116 / sequence_SO=supercontig / SO=protein_coding / is_pseudo=false